MRSTENCSQTKINRTEVYNNRDNNEGYDSSKISMGGENSAFRSPNTFIALQIAHHVKGKMISSEELHDGSSVSASDEEINVQDDEIETISNL